MLVAVYGVPRSGKTTLCDQLVHNYSLSGKHVIHIKPNHWYPPFQTIYTIIETGTSMEQKIQIIENYQHELTRFSQNYDIVFLDCHFAYLNEQGVPLPAYPNMVHCIYDSYFYLDTRTSTVLSRMEQTNGIKDVYCYSPEEIERWKQFESEKLRKLLSMNQKPLYCIGSGGSPLEESISILKQC